MSRNDDYPVAHADFTCTDLFPVVSTTLGDVFLPATYAKLVRWKKMDQVRVGPAISLMQCLISMGSSGSARVRTSCEPQSFNVESVYFGSS